MSSIGEQLRRAREARGWSIDRLARHTRIGAAHIRAIESDRFDELPEGPYRTAWIRILCEELGVEEPSEPLELPRPVVSLQTVRLIGLGTLFAALGLFVWIRWGPEPGALGSTHTPARSRDQRVEITALRNVDVQVWVDGQPVLHTKLPGGKKEVFEAYTRVEVEVGEVQAVRLRYNGMTIVPQGRQDAPRRLEFIDDGAP